MPNEITHEVRGVHVACNDALKKLERIFSKDMRLTLVARHLHDPESYFLFTRDDLAKVVETIQRSDESGVEVRPR